MARKKKGPPPGPVQESAVWQGPSHERLSLRAIERGDASTGVSREAFVELATRPLGQLAQAARASPGEDDERRTPAQVAQYLHRFSKEGQLPAGFEPQRHSVVICGRPVQVPAGICFNISQQLLLQRQLLWDSEPIALFPRICHHGTVSQSPCIRTIPKNIYFYVLDIVCLAFTL